MPEQFDEMLNDGRSPESEIFSTVTHRLNLPQSWQRITSYTVADAKFKRQLEAAVQKARESQLKEIAKSRESELDVVKRDLNSKTADLNEFLELTNNEIDTKNNEINSLKDEVTSLNEKIDDLGDSLRALEAANDAMKFALQEKLPLSKPAEDSLVRDAAAASLKGGIATVEDMLRLVGSLYPDRVVILDTAFKSAKESRVFKNPERVLALLLDLVGDYWKSLNDGKGDNEAKKVFGSAYAASEADKLSKEALKRRTFKYEGHSVVMLMHLKIGVKDTIAETLRIHFEWFADKRKIVVGHCGRHLKL